MHASIFEQGVLETSEPYSLVDKAQFLGLWNVRMRVKRSWSGIRPHLDAANRIRAAVQSLPVLFS